MAAITLHHSNGFVLNTNTDETSENTPNKEEREVILKRAEVHQIAYLRTVSQLNPNDTVTAKVHVLVGMKSGCLIGGGVGTVFGPKGILIGTPIGTLAGGIAGYIYFILNRSREFEKWKKLNDKTMDQFNKVFREGVFEDYDFMCPISGTVMEMPTITPCFHTFDFLPLQEWLTKKGKEHRPYLLNGNPVCLDQLGDNDARIPNPEYGLSRCPACRTAIKMEDLRPSYIIMGKLTVVCKSFVEKTPDRRPSQITKLQFEGFSTLLIDLEKRGTWCYEMEKKHQQKLLDAKKISDTEFHLRMFRVSAAIRNDHKESQKI